MITKKQLAAKIKALREEIGFTQESLAKKVGLTRQAILGIESEKRDIDGIELAKIAEALKTSPDFLLAENQDGAVKNSANKIKTVFHPEKLRNLILYILARCGGKPNVGETVLYKLLYFIDFDSFEVTGAPITGLEYLKLQFGPVPCSKTYQAVIEAMVNADELKIIKQNYGGYVQKKYIALADPDKDAFPYEEIKLINSVIDRLSDMTATSITDYVHEDIPWKLTPVYGVIDYRLVWERTASFSRLDKEMLWQNAAGSDSLKRLGKMSKEEFDYYKNL